MFSKKFNAWISKNFKGLSAHTLFQFLCMECPQIPEHHISNMVHVDLYHVFCGTANDDEQNTFNAITDIVCQCAWL